MNSEAIVYQRKITGVLMRAAREKMRRAIPEVAQRLGVTPARMRQYEQGKREISLPELEILSLYLKTPLSFFLNKESAVQGTTLKSPSVEEMRTRRAMLGAKLKQARLAEGKTREDCAQAVERTPAMIGRYERGLTDIPITELETLARFLQLTLFDLVAREPADSEMSDVLDLEKLAHLPKDVSAFILESGNLPYLRMAMKFADLPTNRLKELGEILLVVR